MARERRQWVDPETGEWMYDDFSTEDRRGSTPREEEPTQAGPPPTTTTTTPPPTTTTTTPPTTTTTPPPTTTTTPGGGGRTPQPSSPGNIPGTTAYPIPGGQKFFDYPDFNPAPVAYPDFIPGSFGLGKFEAPPDTAGEWKAPSWDVGAPPTLSAFDYPEFQGPTSETFRTDPGYEWRAAETERAIKNNRSAQGLLSTGGTLQDLMAARGSLASQEFGNIWNRQFGAHQENRAAAQVEHDKNEQAKLKQYELVYGAESDELRRAQEDYATKRAYDSDTSSRGLASYQTNYACEQDKFSRALTTYLTGYGRKADDFNREKDIYGTNLAKEAGAYGLNLDTGRVNLAGDGSRWDNLLSLYNLSTRNMPTYTAPTMPSF